MENVSESVSVVLPTYNEKENITHAIGRTAGVLRPKDEIIVVDDDSPDETWQIAQEAFARDSRVSVVRRTEEQGLATAVVRGIEESTSDFVVVMDADLQHPPEKIPDLIAAFDQTTDLVVGSRYVSNGGIENWSVFRKLVSRGAGVLSKAIVRRSRGIRDPMSGFFAVRRGVVKGVELNPEGYKILLEIISKSNISSKREVPFNFSERTSGESKLSRDQYIKFLKHLFRLRIDDERRYTSPSELGAEVLMGTILFTLTYLLVLS